MKFREYEYGDEFLIDLVATSDFKEHPALFSDDTVAKVTIEDDHGIIVAIIAWKDIGNDDYWVCSFISKKIGIKVIYSIREVFQNMANKLRAKRCFTYSNINDSVDKWHKFMGFEKDVIVDIDGKQLNRWVALWA